MTYLLVMPGTTQQRGRIRKWLKRHLEYRTISIPPAILIHIPPDKEQRDRLLAYIAKQMDKGEEEEDIAGHIYKDDVKVWIAVRVWDSGALYEGMKELG